MNDLNQYPVFPWVISNYEADNFDISLASNFRNFAQVSERRVTSHYVVLPVWTFVVLIKRLLY